jgi:hypothetical protein
VQWRGRYYSEQYLLAAWILAGPARLRLVFSSMTASFDPALVARLHELFAGSPLAYLIPGEGEYGDIPRARGSSFWAVTA